jgi:capsular polysaccharide biosynthesis protein
MDEINIEDYLLILKKRIWIIISVTLLVTILSAIATLTILENIYQVNTTLYVGTKVSAQTGDIAYQDLLMGGQLVKDYIEFAKSRLISDIIVSELNLKNRAETGLISITQRSDTRIIEITVQSSDPARAVIVANKFAEVFKRKAIELIDAVNIQVIDTAVMPSAPIKPNKKLNVAISFVLGFMLSIGIIFFIEYLDNTIKTPEDIQKHLGLIVIGTIPDFLE